MSAETKFTTLRKYLRSIQAGQISRTEIRAMKSRLRKAAMEAPRKYTNSGRAKVRMYPAEIFAEAVKPVLESRAAKVVSAIAVMCLMSGCGEDQSPAAHAFLNYSIVCFLTALVAGAIGYLIGTQTARWSFENAWHNTKHRIRKDALELLQRFQHPGKSRELIANILREVSPCARD